MKKYLVLRLKGPLQAWGTHSYEDYRPSNLFPTRSGIVGLLAACLGIERSERDRLASLGESIHLAVRADRETEVTPTVLADFHTVMEARKVDGKVNPNPVVSRREYLCDASFTVVLGLGEGTAWSIEVLKAALLKPVYTPYLGRRSCALTRPLFECIMEGDSLFHTMSKISPYRGVVYSEEAEDSSSRLLLRDVPIATRQRQFSTRYVHILINREGEDNVPH